MLSGILAGVSGLHVPPTFVALLVVERVGFHAVTAI